MIDWMRVKPMEREDKQEAAIEIDEIINAFEELGIENEEPEEDEITPIVQSLIETPKLEFFENIQAHLSKIDDEFRIGDLQKEGITLQAKAGQFKEIVTRLNTNISEQLLRVADKHEKMLLKTAQNGLDDCIKEITNSSNTSQLRKARERTKLHLRDVFIIRLALQGDKQAKEIVQLMNLREYVRDASTIQKAQNDVLQIYKKFFGTDRKFSDEFLKEKHNLKHIAAEMQKSIKQSDH